MNEQLDKISLQIAELHGKVDAINASLEKSRQRAMLVFWITVAVIVLPLFILPLLLPSFLSSIVVPVGF